MIGQYTKEGKLVGTWKSQTEASLVTGVKRSNISACCYGKLKMAGGYRWSFIDKEEKKDGR